jgi:hypothetical protein
MHNAKLAVLGLVFAAVLIAVAAFPQENTHADVGEVPMPGAMITLGDTTDQISMKSEGVVFEVMTPETESGDMCPFTFTTDDDCWYASVNAVFIMENTSGTDVTLDVFYPFPSMLDVWGGGDTSMEDHSKNFSVQVRDSYLDYSVTSYPMMYEGSETNIPSLEFPVTFPAGAETEIWITYQTRLVYEPKSQYGSFIYLMQTGSNWAGSIGEGWLRFKFRDEIFPEMFIDLSDDFVIDGNELTWDFSDLEPGVADNKKVTFSPRLYKIVSGLPEYYETVSASEYEETAGPLGIDEALIPAGYQVSPSTRVSANSPMYLLDPVVSGESAEEYYPNWGWVVSLEGENAPYIMYDLDAVYEVSGIEVFSGIPVYLTNATTWEEVELYTLLNRPKDLKLTFSDGTSVTVTVDDDPDALLSAAFEPVETSSVKVEFVDTYPGETGGGEVLGLSRMYLGVGDKIREKDAVVGDAETDADGDAVTGTSAAEDGDKDTSFWNNLNDTTRALVTVAATAVVLGGAVTAGYAVAGKIGAAKMGAGKMAGKAAGKVAGGAGVEKGAGKVAGGTAEKGGINEAAASGTVGSAAAADGKGNTAGPASRSVKDVK